MASGIVESSQSGSQQQPQQNQPISRTRLVQRLLAASANLPNFIHDLILTQAQLVAGTEAAAFLIEPAAAAQPAPESAQDGADPAAQQAPARDGFTLKPIAHIRPDNSDAETRAAAIQAFQEIIRPCVAQNKDGAIAIDGTHDGSEQQYCLVTLLRAEGNPVAVSAVITRSRDLDRARQRLELMNLVGGYFELFTLRRTSEQSRAIAQSHQHVLQLATAVATADGFDAAAMSLCNELASRTGATRVSLGWVRGNGIKLKALSHTEQFDKKQELSVQLVKVMEECLDNDEIVQYEPQGATSNTVTREAQALSRAQGGETVLSLPLRRKGEVVGVITLEFAPNTRITAQAAQGLAVAVELLAPQLYDRYQNDRYLITKTGLAIQELGRKTIGPKYMLAKTIVVLVLAAAAFVTFYKPMYRVSAPFKFVAEQKYALSAPFEGTLKEVYVKPDDDVQAGQLLAEFDATEYKLQYSTYLQEANAKETEALRYDVEPDKASEAQQARAEAAAARAKADYYASLIERAKIVSPIAGKVLVGDLKDRRHSVFRQGEPLFEIGQLDKLRVELAVADRDIQDVHENRAGRLATTALPNDKYPFVVERIVPLGVQKDASNVFTVYARLDMESPDWPTDPRTGQKIIPAWRPGMHGEARVDVEHRRLVWIWTHKFIEWVRLKLWI
ncbi:efflux RND transporter periplasmic adaptor subunit [Fontivita pretiosa]|uniref:efflux RND transporter periplasmic adaptor subunit n=1 Tax=Fontivita pretiosa TaxID=2989684 RepID=UPI003D1785B9